MEGHRGWSSTPSYKEAIANKGKKPPDYCRGTVEEGRRKREVETEGTKMKENESTKDNEEDDKKQGTKDKKQKGQCKPKAEITPKVVLNDPAL